MNMDLISAIQRTEEKSSSSHFTDPEEMDEANIDEHVEPVVNLINNEKHSIRPSTMLEMSFSSSLGITTKPLAFKKVSSMNSTGYG